MEDLLTSNVFGAITYVSPEEGLLPLLANSIDSRDSPPTHILQPVSKTEYHFWPWIQEAGCEGCEPDVRIDITLKNGKKAIVFVEAKYLSGKSSGPSEGEIPHDQLAREWHNLKCLAKRSQATPVLLYVTADFGYPSASIKESCQAYTKKQGEPMDIYWISWRKLPRLFSNRKQDVSKRDILIDLVQVLNRQGLTLFEGITIPEPKDITWSFKTQLKLYWSLYSDHLIPWNFKVNKDLN